MRACWRGAPTNCSKGADHVENLRDGALIERVHVDVGADERCCDISLKIRERQDKIGFEIEDLRNVGSGSWVCTVRLKFDEQLRYSGTDRRKPTKPDNRPPHRDAVNQSQSASA
jgi:hypothetical protein